jgi:hypothetical protein
VAEAAATQLEAKAKVVVVVVVKMLEVAGEMLEVVGKMLLKEVVSEVEMVKLEVEVDTEAYILIR